jgi:type I restriction enzyme S subunit
MRNGWKAQKLGDVFQIKPPKNEAKKRLSSDDLVSFVPMEDLGILSKNFRATKSRPFGEVSGSYTYFAENDVLVAKITPCFENGKMGIARNLINGIGFGSSEFIVFRSNGCVSSEYLFYFLSADQFREEGKRRMSGAVGHKRVQKEFVENLLIPFPVSIGEQSRIVAVLDKVFAGIDKAKANAEQNLKNSKELFESYLQEFFERQMNSVGGIMLKEICDLQNGFAFKSADYISSSSTMLFRMSQIRPDGRIDLDNNPRYLPDAYFEKYKEYTLSDGDIVIAMTDMATETKILGVPTLIKKDHRNLLLNQRVGRFINIDLDRVHVPYLRYILTSSQINLYYKSLGHGGVQINIGKPDILNARIPLPDIHTQKSAATLLDTLSFESNRIANIYQRKLLRLEQLKKSILQKAFSGELTREEVPA